MKTASDKTPIGQNLNATNGSIDPTNIIIGSGDDDYGRASSTSFNYDPYHPKVAVDIEVKEDTIEITYVQRAMYTYYTYNNPTITIGGPQSQIYNPDKVFKEIYGVKDNKLTLLRTVTGRIIPPQLEESYEFPE